jgi:hypothetical protein
VGVLAASISEIASAILDRCILMKELTEGLPQVPSPTDFEALEHALAFWGSASQDQTVRKRLQEDRLPFTLYKLLRSSCSEADSNEGGMLAALPTPVVTGVVDLVRGLVVGHPALEAELADLLIEDLDRLSRQRDMDFVNKVFLPLIKVEKSVPVTLGPARSNTESAQTGAMLPDISSLVEDQSQEALAGPSSFMGTSLLQQKHKEYLKVAFKQIVGEATSKTQVEKLLTGNWAKVHEQSSSSKTTELSDLGLWRQLEGRGPCLALTTGQGPNG